MTCCFSYSSKRLTMVAADTRITYITTDGRILLIDGPTDGDNSFIEAYPGKAIVYPYHYRKIRFIGPGWATASGSSELSAYILDLLKEKRPTSHEDTISVIGANVSRLANLAAAMTGFELENIYKTTIYVGHLKSQTQSITLDSKLGIGEVEKADMFINWPLDISEEDKSKAEDIFFQA